MRYVSIKRAAEISGIPERTFRRWCAEGKVRAIKRAGARSWYIDLMGLKVGGDAQRTLCWALFHGMSDGEYGMPASRYITVKRAAEISGRPERTIRRWCQTGGRSGRLVAIRRGGVGPWLIDLNALAETGRAHIDEFVLGLE
jgi:hypothetical protein